MRHGTRVALRDTPGLWRYAGDMRGTYVVAPLTPEAFLYLWSTIGVNAHGLVRWPDDVAPVGPENTPAKGQQQ